MSGITWDQIKDVPLSDKVFDVMYEANADELALCAKEFGISREELRLSVYVELFIPGMTVGVAAMSLKMFMTSILDIHEKFDTVIAGIRHGIEYGVIAACNPMPVEYKAS